METLNTFLNIIAWGLAVFGSIAFMLHSTLGWGYEGSPKQISDMCKGYQRVYRPWRWFIVAFIGWAWIAAS